ncbi:unnamed protein product, partial [Didymodactylos carnosus]
MVTAEIVYPLAFPKNTSYKCEICDKPANRVCKKCHCTYYCSEEHQTTDWNGIHEKICKSLEDLRKKQVFLLSEEERREKDRETRERKINLMEMTRMIGQRHLFQERYEQAIPAALSSLKLAVDVYGPKSVDLIPSYLILAEASLGLKHLGQCWEYLSQAQYTVLQNPNPPLYITSKLYRNLAQLNIARKDYEEALRNLANDVYDASTYYGTEHHKVAGGYFLLGKVFKLLNKLEVTDSLYKQVSDMWYTHLRKLLESRVVWTDMDQILGKKEEEEVPSSAKLDLSTEAEAHITLQTLLSYRQETSIKQPDQLELNKINHAISILHFLSRDYTKVTETMSRITDNQLTEIDEDQAL